LLHGDHRRGQVDLAVGKVAAQQRTHGGAAALRRQNAGHVGAVLLEEAFGERNGIGHAVGGDAVIADDDLLGVRRGQRRSQAKRQQPWSECHRVPPAHPVGRNCFVASPHCVASYP
jgi:hypothetical protein